MYTLTEAAAKDIDEILDRLPTDFGARQTQTHYDSLKRWLELLGENPGLGSGADEIRPGYRRFSYQSHVVFYLPRDQVILVVRILHHRMDAARNVRD